GPDGLAPPARASPFGSPGGVDASTVRPATSVPATRARASTTTLRIFVIDIAIITPSVSAATLAEITPVAAARPAVTRVAALIVDATRAGGAAPDADPDANTAATDPPENTPRRASRFASIARARARRLATLPSRSEERRVGK